MLLQAIVHLSAIFGFVASQTQPVQNKTEFYSRDQLHIIIDEFFPPNNLSNFTASASAGAAEIAPFINKPHVSDLGFNSCSKTLKKHERAFFVFCTDGIRSSILWYSYKHEAFPNKFTPVSEVSLEDRLVLVDYDFDPSSNQLFVMGSLQGKLYLYSYNPLNPVGPYASISLDFLTLSKSLKISKSRNATQQTLMIYESIPKQVLELHMINYTNYAFADAGFWSSAKNISGLFAGTVHGYLFNDVSGYAVISDSQSNLLLQACPVHFAVFPYIQCKTTNHRIMVFLGSNFFIQMESFDVNSQSLRVTAINRGSVSLGCFDRSGVYTNQQTYPIDLGTQQPDSKFLTLAVTAKGDIYAAYTALGHMYAVQVLATKNTYLIRSIDQVVQDLAAPYFQSNPIDWEFDDFVVVGNSKLMSCHIERGHLLVVDLQNQTKAVSFDSKVLVQETTWANQIEMLLKVWSEVGAIQPSDGLFVSEYDYFLLPNQSVQLKPLQSELRGNDMTYSMSSAEAKISNSVYYFNNSKVTFDMIGPGIDIISIFPLNYGHLVIRYRNSTVSIFMCQTDQKNELSCYFRMNTGSLTCTNIIDGYVFEQDNKFNVVVLTTLSTGSLIIEFLSKGSINTYAFPVKILTGKFNLDFANNRLAFVGFGKYLSSATLRGFIVEMNITGSAGVVVPNQMQQLTGVDLDNLLTVTDFNWIDSSSFQILGQIPPASDEEPPRYRLIRYVLVGDSPLTRDALLWISGRVPHEMFDSSCMSCLLGESLWIASSLQNAILTIEMDASGSLTFKSFRLNELILDLHSVQAIECNQFAEALTVLTGDDQIFIFNARKGVSPMLRLLTASTAPIPGASVVVSQVFVDAHDQMLYHLFLGTNDIVATVQMLSGPSITSLVLASDMPDAKVTLTVNNKRSSIAQTVVFNKIPFTNGANWIVNKNINVDEVFRGSFFKIKELLTIDAPIGNFSISPASAEGKVAQVSQYFTADAPYWDFSRYFILGEQTLAKRLDQYLFIYTRGNMYCVVSQPNQTLKLLQVQVNLDEFLLFNTTLGPGVIYLKNNQNLTTTIGVIYNPTSKAWQIAETKVFGTKPTLSSKNLFILNKNLTSQANLLITVGFLNNSFDGAQVWVGYLSLSHDMQLKILDQLEVPSRGLAVSNAALINSLDGLVNLFIIFSNSLQQTLIRLKTDNGFFTIVSSDAVSTLDSEEHIPSTDSFCKVRQKYHFECAFIKSRSIVVGIRWDFSTTKLQAQQMFALNLVPTNSIGSIFFNHKLAVVFVVASGRPAILFYQHTETTNVMFSLTDPSFSTKSNFDGSVVDYNNGQSLLLLVGTTYQRGKYLLSQDAGISVAAQFKPSDFTDGSINLTINSVDGSVKTNIDFSVLFYKNEGTSSRLVWFILLFCFGLAVLLGVLFFLRSKNLIGLGRKKQHSAQSSLKEETDNYYNFSEQEKLPPHLKPGLLGSAGSQGTQKKGMSKSFEDSKL